MKKAILSSGIFILCLGRLFFSVPAAFAYSIYAHSGVGAQSDQPSGATTSIDFGSAWNQLSAPFQIFFNSLGNVSQNDLRTQINPSTQIQSMIPGSKQGIVAEVLNFISFITGWLISLADNLAKWVISTKP